MTTGLLIILAVVGFLFPFTLMQLFPYPGPGAIVTTPLTWGMWGLGTFAFYLLSHYVDNPYMLIGIYFVLSLVLVISSIQLFSSDTGEQPFREIKEAFSVWKRFDEVTYDDVHFGHIRYKDPWRTAALYKFRDRLPERTTKITYSPNTSVDEESPTTPKKKSFLIEMRKGEVTTTNEHLDIAYQEDGTIVFREVYAGQEVVLKEPRDVFSFGSNYSGPVGELYVSVRKVWHYPESGFNRLFYTWLRLTR